MIIARLERLPTHIIVGNRCYNVWRGQWEALTPLWFWELV
jgi:hypothetical protein